MKVWTSVHPAVNLNSHRRPVCVRVVEVRPSDVRDRMAGPALQALTAWRPDPFLAGWRWTTRPGCLPPARTKRLEGFRCGGRERTSRRRDRGRLDRPLRTFTLSRSKRGLSSGSSLGRLGAGAVQIALASANRRFSERRPRSAGRRRRDALAGHTGPIGPTRRRPATRALVVRGVGLSNARRHQSPDPDGMLRPGVGQQPVRAAVTPYRRARWHPLPKSTSWVAGHGG